MQYRITLEVSFPPDASFVEADPITTPEVLDEMFRDVMWDLDDITLDSIEIEEIKNDRV